jgi:hypothetical protein
MDVNDNACFLDKRAALEFIASKLAPTNRYKGKCRLNRALNAAGFTGLAR